MCGVLLAVGRLLRIVATRLLPCYSPCEEAGGITSGGKRDIVLPFKVILLYCLMHTKCHS